MTPRSNSRGYLSLLQGRLVPRIGGPPTSDGNFGLALVYPIFRPNRTIVCGTRQFVLLIWAVFQCVFFFRVRTSMLLLSVYTYRSSLCCSLFFLSMQVTQAIKKIRTRRRVALTGSPLQNNLVEYYTMVDFVRQGMLGTLERFKNYFEAPIVNGMLVDSSPYDVKVRVSSEVPCIDHTHTQRNDVRGGV